MIKHDNIEITKGEFVSSTNTPILIRLNRGALWVKLEHEDVILYGADLNAWMGQDNLYVIKDGEKLEIPASTEMKGYYA